MRLMPFLLCCALAINARADTDPAVAPLSASPPRAPIPPELRQKADMLLSQGNEFLQDGELKAAGIRFRQLLEIDPTNPFGHYSLAETLRQQGDNKNAAAQYRMVMELAPGSAEAVIAHARLNEMGMDTAMTTPASGPVATPPL